MHVHASLIAIYSALSVIFQPNCGHCRFMMKTGSPAVIAWNIHQIVHLVHLFTVLPSSHESKSLGGWPATP